MVSEALQRYQSLCGSLDDAVRWACTLEAISPKLGNVHPTARFADLAIVDFINAGEALAISVQEGGSLGTIVHRAVKSAVEQSRTNVNLGIALLVAPMSIAFTQKRSIDWVLSNLTADDSRLVYAAIRLANPGGMGQSEEMDVSGEAPVKLMDAMTFAKDRDLIARQYASGFDDLWKVVVPQLEDSIRRNGDVLLGIRDAHIRIMAVFTDTLIERKCGPKIAEEVRSRAGQVISHKGSAERFAAERELDFWLRADGNRRNPGAMADLIAAGLFALLVPNEFIGLKQ
jgi:triphosphoribosyl-dephospho-CoA synthase